MKRYLCLSVLMLAFVLVFSGCDSFGDSDDWSPVVAVEHANGSWQGSYSQNLSIKDYMETYNFGWDQILESIFDDLNVTSTIDINTTVNSDTMRQTGTARASERYSGSRIRDLWPSLKQDFITSGAQVDDSNYSIFITESINKSVSLADFAGMEINQNYNKIRVRASEYGFIGNDYIVLNKQ